MVGTKGLLMAENTMGQTAGGSLIFIDGASGRPGPLAFDADSSPFTEQVRAFGSALRRPEERAAWSAARDLHTMRLVARAYGQG